MGIFKQKLLKMPMDDALLVLGCYGCGTIYKKARKHKENSNGLYVAVVSSVFMFIFFPTQAP
jgi:hypothetical protein